MAFGQYADILFEPSVALQEGKATQSGMDADTELAFFRAADNSDPTHFANIALMRTDSLPAPLSPVPSAQPLTFPDCLSQYSVVYPIVLKIALIELDGGAMEERMIRFLDWMYESWIMSAVATNLAAICFSSSPPRGLFKHLRHSDRQFALKGLRNATWDLAYVMWWRQLLQRQSRENRLFLFCTRDRALMKIAKQLLAPPDLSDVDVQQNLQSILGARAYKHYWTLIVCSEKCRAIDRPEGLAESGLVRALEEALLRTNH